MQIVPLAYNWGGFDEDYEYVPILAGTHIAVMHTELDADEDGDVCMALGYGGMMELVEFDVPAYMINWGME